MKSCGKHAAYSVSLSLKSNTYPLTNFWCERVLNIQSNQAESYCTQSTVSKLHCRKNWAYPSSAAKHHLMTDLGSDWNRPNVWKEWDKACHHLTPSSARTIQEKFRIWVLLTAHNWTRLEQNYTQTFQGFRTADSGFISDITWRQKETLERAHLLFLPRGNEEMSHSSPFVFNSDIMSPGISLATVC